MRTQKRAIAYLPNAILIASMLILPALTFAQERNTASTRRSWGYAFAGAHRGERGRVGSFFLWFKAHEPPRGSFFNPSGFEE